MPLVIRTMRADPGEVEALALLSLAAVFSGRALAGDGARARSRHSRGALASAKLDDFIDGDGGVSALITREIGGRATPG